LKLGRDAEIFAPVLATFLLTSAHEKEVRGWRR